jgi:DNA-binding response OmpR family regulator
MKILVVDDEALIALAAKDILEEAGHDVIGPAGSVRQALAAVERERPDLALLDINLGRGGNGIILARILKRRWSVPSIFVTGDSKDARDSQDVALGLIVKPWVSRTILAALSAAHAIASGLRPPPSPGIELFHRQDR